MEATEENLGIKLTQLKMALVKDERRFRSRKN